MTHIHQAYCDSALLKHSITDPVMTDLRFNLLSQQSNPTVSDGLFANRKEEEEEISTFF